MKHKQSGFTLIEIMIVILVIGILSAVAFPSYKEYVMKARRGDVQVELLDYAQRMERCFTEFNNAYNNVGCEVNNDFPGGVNNLANGKYRLNLVTPNAASFTLTATPLADQAQDTECAVIGIDQTGAQTETGTGALRDCWKN